VKSFIQAFNGKVRVRIVAHFWEPIMSAPVIDIHPHIISADMQRYPHAPLYGIQSTWSKDRPADVDQLLEAMDEAGVAKAAIVHASTCYGFDNSLVADAAVTHAGRCTAVGPWT